MKNTNPLSLKNIIMAIFMGTITKPFNNTKVNFPKKIGTFKFVKEIKVTGKHNLFTYALYENNKKEKAFAKIWSGRFKDFPYLTLQNEANIYEILNSATKRNKRSIPKRFEDIQIPKFIKKVEEDNMLLLLTEFVEGKTADELKASEQIKIYLKTADFFSYLGSRLTKKEKSRISHRSTTVMVILYAPFLLKALITNPRVFTNLLKGVPIFTKAIPGILKLNNVKLGHRDMHLGNIMVSKNKISILDLQFCIFSEELYEILTTLRIHWSDKEFRNLLLLEIEKKHGKKLIEDKIMKGMMVNAATHGLTGGKLPKNLTNSFRDYLSYSVGNKI